MRKRKRRYKRIFFVALGGFFLLIGTLVGLSCRKAVRESFWDQQTEQAERTEKTETGLAEENQMENEVKEVNEANDKEHIAGAELFPIEEAETYIEPVTGLWIYKIHEKVETYAERYAPDSTKAVCLNSAPSKESASCVLFFMELDGREAALILAEFDTTTKDVTVKECTCYTKEEILNEVWVMQGGPTVRDMQ